jgi:hypothetical protein
MQYARAMRPAGSAATARNSKSAAVTARSVRRSANTVRRVSASKPARDGGIGQSGPFNSRRNFVRFASVMLFTRNNSTSVK